LKKSKHAVETNDLSISWGELNVLDKINFKLYEGEKLAIIGPKIEIGKILVKRLIIQKKTSINQ